MLKFYKEKIFYRLMNFSLGREKIKRSRHELLSNISGEVLEIGFGTGLNVNCSPNFIHTITAIDVSQFEPCYIYPRIQIHRLIMSAGAMTFPDGSFDSLVSTFTLCSIPNIQAALSEIKRVLKPHGKFLFLEHGKSPNRFISGLQNLVNSFYNLFADRCNVNRDILQLISESGLDIQAVQKPALHIGLLVFVPLVLLTKKVPHANKQDSIDLSLNGVYRPKRTSSCLRR